MRTISAEIITAIQTGAIKPFICVNIDDSFYFTICDTPIYISGTKYSPRAMTPGNFSYSLGNIVDSASLSISNEDDTLTSTLMTGDVQGSDVTIYLVYLDSNNENLGNPITLFLGSVDAWTMSEGNVELTITSDLARWSKRTFNQHQSSCRWKEFKGTQCGYAGGETVCNRTFTRCAELSNTAHYGGFRWLPYIERKSVVWGDSSGNSLIDSTKWLRRKSAQT